MSTLYRNQSGIIDVENYDYLNIAIIGLGSIGSFTALALDKLGFKNLILIDGDRVEKHNTTTQLYHINNVGEYKVNAMRGYLNNKPQVHASKINSKSVLDVDVIFVCVDSLKQRKIILKSILDTYQKTKGPKLIVDGRMHRLFYKVCTVDLKKPNDLKKYANGLMAKPFKGACTEKGIIQNVFAVVATMTEQFKKCLKGQDYFSELTCNLEMFEVLGSGKNSMNKKKKVK